MSQNAGTGEVKPKPPRDPFGPPLEPAQVREFFRRLQSRPFEEQQAFVAKVNWNLLDDATAHAMIGWLIEGLRSPDPARQAFVVKLLDKLPHFRRARHAPRFQPVLPSLSPELAAQVADAFGPVLGGAPKRPAKPGAAPAKKPAAPKPTPAPPREATDDDLSKLKDFFGKFGGAK